MRSLQIKKKKIHFMLKKRISIIEFLITNLKSTEGKTYLFRDTIKQEKKIFKS